MRKFVRSKLALPKVKDYIKEMMEIHGATRAQAKASYNRLKRDEIWVNDLYQVNIDYNPPHNCGDDQIIHLSIKRLDKDSIHDWRHLQLIKNELVGPEREAVEIYPAESRLIDTVNQYHLWVLPPGARVPFGWWERKVEGVEYPGDGSRQRPFDKE